MNIGIDIDGVLTNDDDYVIDNSTKFLYEHNLDTFIDANKYELRKYNWSKEEKDLYNSIYLWDYAKNEPARRYASEVITKLKNAGNKIYIITSRTYTDLDNELGIKMRAIVKNWLKENNIPYDDIYFSKCKENEIKALGIDVLIEDHPTKIPDYCKLTHVFCFDTRYNHDLTNSNMTRVFSWYDILLKIEEMLNER